MSRSPLASGSSTNPQQLLISSCIFILYPDCSGQSPDAVYADCAPRRRAQARADLWSAMIRADARNCEAEKLARADYCLAGHAPEAAPRLLEAASTPAQGAARSQTARGHFWIAANLGALAESSGGGMG